MLLSNWNWNTLEVFGEEGRVEVRGRGREGKERERREGEERRWGRKVGGGDRGRGRERREKRGTLRALDDVFMQLKLEHAGDACTCMWKRREDIR